MPPPDTRRICGPESSRDYRIFVSTKEKKKEIVEGRPDGRSKDDEHRPVCEHLNKLIVIVRGRVIVVYPLSTTPHRPHISSD